MRKVWFTAAIAAILFITALNALAGSVVTPNTTLSAETGNNTSTSDSFQGWSNGDEAPTNVSKVDTRTLLYSGSSTKIFAHFLPWFGQGGHKDVGYNSADPTQVTKQVVDMMSRGIQGMIIDWYGQKGAQEDTTTQYVMSAAEAHSPFMFAVMEDAGAIRGCGSCQGALISDLTYAYNKYEQSPAYFRVNGRPVVFFFDAETLPGVNLAAAQAAVPGNPIFIVKDANGFTAAGSDGAYSWVTDTFNNSNWGQAYLDYFYQIGVANGSKQAFGASKKGFNDNMASWGANRVVPQNCGQTWLNTFGEIGKYYSPSNQLDNLQLVTWNDYEEGTALEMGVDNCVSISGSASGDTVSWTITGSENTLDHYTVYISSDGQNLMPVVDVPAGTHQLNLGQYGFPQGAYTVYVKAVGRPSIKNHVSGAISYTSSGTGGTTTAGAGSSGSGGVTASSGTVTAAPPSLTVASGKSGTMTVTLSPTSTFTGTASLGCGGLPAGVTCSFANPSLLIASAPVSTTLTISVGTTSTASLAPHSGMFAFWLPGLGLGMVVVGNQRRSRKFWAGLVLLVLLAVLVSVGCGGVGANAAAKAATNGNGTAAAAATTITPGTYPITIQATVGSSQQTTTATLVIN